MAQAFGIVSFAGNNIRVGEMQNYRPVGAVSFLGRYLSLIHIFLPSKITKSSLRNLE